jgi:hypothetical protein
MNVANMHFVSKALEDVNGTSDDVKSFGCWRSADSFEPPPINQSIFAFNVTHRFMQLSKLNPRQCVERMSGVLDDADRGILKGLRLISPTIIKEAIPRIFRTIEVEAVEVDETLNILYPIIPPRVIEKLARSNCPGLMSQFTYFLQVFDIPGALNVDQSSLMRKILAERGIVGFLDLATHDPSLLYWDEHWFWSKLAQESRVEFLFPYAMTSIPPTDALGSSLYMDVSQAQIDKDQSVVRLPQGSLLLTWRSENYASLPSQFIPTRIWVEWDNTPNKSYCDKLTRVKSSGRTCLWINRTDEVLNLHFRPTS